MKKILFVSSEAVPYVKTGGLADVVGSLPKYFDKKEYDVRVVIPKYACMDRSFLPNLKFLCHFYVNLNWRRQYVGIFESEYHGVHFYFVDNEFYFAGESPYNNIYEDVEKFAYFSKAVLASLPYIDFAPDIIHCNDWQTGLIPVFLHTVFGDDNFYAGIKTVFTIHNLQFQGRWRIQEIMDITGLPAHIFNAYELESYGEANYLKGGVVYADYITTVSPTYANEITTVEGGEGLSGLMTARKDRLYGILNGIDYEEYKIYDLGEGIQSIILMTLPLFLYLDKSKEKNTNVLVFIEEPEIGLHPRLQRIFIETLLDERFENYQFFFTTHSNHFIDQTLESEEISIYLFDKLLNEGVSNVEFHIKPINLDYYPALKKLGALPSSVLISNCTILVEGTYDIPHYTLYLDLYQKHLQEKNPNFRMYKEDVHYSFFRGGGNETLNTIDEFNDYENERNFFISDSDDENKKEKLEQYFLEIGYDNFYILDVKEVENLISKKVLLKILKNMRETKNLDISDDFNEIDYQKSHFYNFITKNIIKETLPDNFMGEEGFKKRFSFKEKKFAKDYNDLSEPAKLVAKEIFRFIEKNNPVI